MIWPSLRALRPPSKLGSYSKGHYVRNTSEYHHSPFSKEGCTIFVKLYQFDRADTQRKVIDTHKAEWLPGMVPGLTVLPLHRFGDENVALVKWEPGTKFSSHRHDQGEEILVLEGIFEDENGQYPKGYWLRNPPGSRHTPFSEKGCVLYVKTGHLSPKTLLNFT